MEIKKPGNMTQHHNIIRYNAYIRFGNYPISPQIIT